MNTITWFEIPTTQLGRATEFYTIVTGQKLELVEEGNMPMAVFPGTPGSVHGCLVKDDKHAPGKGTVVYFDATAMPGGLDGALERAGQSGGEVVLPRTAIGPHGFIGLIKDSEGNVVGLHQMT